jgi:tetratricopeptide (TPR) repeat protein
MLLGEFAKAEQYFGQWSNTGPEHSNSLGQMNYEIGYVYDQLGRTDEAAKIFEAQIKRQESELNNSVAANLDLARIYAFTGNRDKALNYLTAYTRGGYSWTGNHRGWQDFILIDPFFASLRDDPEFQAIVKQAQEEKAAMRAQVREMEKRGELDL